MPRQSMSLKGTKSENPMEKPKENFYSNMSPQQKTSTACFAHVWRLTNLHVPISD